MFSQTVEYDALSFDVEMTTSLLSAHDLAGLNKNQANATDGLLGAIEDPGADADLLGLASAMALLDDEADIAATHCWVPGNYRCT